VDGLETTALLKKFSSGNGGTLLVTNGMEIGKHRHDMIDCQSMDDVRGAYFAISL